MKILIFGGTKEGRELTESRLREGCEVLACVTSEYARALLPPGARCVIGALDEIGMERLIERESPDAILDATHPYAVRATENIRQAASRSGVPYERVERADSHAERWVDDVEWVLDTDAAALALARVSGNVLLTTGVNTLARYARAVDKERLYARVLPSVSSLTVCESLGILPGHVIAMQGPFTRALNAALYDMLGIRTIVSKDSGAAGGVPEKVIPALEREMHVIMIERPKETKICAEKA